MGRVVLVTGVGRDFGGRFASRIAKDPVVDRVIGVDVVPSRADLGDVHFVRADIRHPVIGKVIADDKVDTVVHLGVIATTSSAGRRASMREVSVVGSMQLLAACQQAASVERLIVKSSARVYGSSPSDPAKFSEDMSPQRIPSSGLGKASVEVEGYVRGFARRRPDVRVTLLRFANLIGPQVDTMMARYLELPIVPTVLGFDPRLQFCHDEDALDALHHSSLADVPGSFNVAGDHVLTLVQAVRRLGRPHIGVPPLALGTLGSLIPQLRQADLSAEQILFLTYGRGLDTTAMRQNLGFEPKFTTPEAFGDFAARSRPGAMHPERVAELERQLATLIAKGRIYGRR